MKIGVLGLCCSHPYSFAEVLKEKGYNMDYAWDEDSDKLTEYCSKYGVKKIENLDEFYRLDLDAVFIDSKNYLHCESAKPFIKKGIGVFIDKPLSTKLEDAVEIINLAKKSGAILMSSSCTRYMPDYVKLAERIKNGEVGTPVAATVNVFHNMKNYLEEPNKWQDNIETGGGEIINMGIHAMEPALMVLGPGIKSVFCTRDSLIYKNAQSEDTAVMQVKFKSGCVATINMLSSVTSFGYEITVYGSKAKIQAGYPPELNAANVSNSLKSFGFTDMVEHFIKSVEERTLPIPLENTLDVIKALTAARQSAETGRAVELNEL